MQRITIDDVTLGLIKLMAAEKQVALASEYDHSRGDHSRRSSLETRMKENQRKPPGDWVSEIVGDWAKARLQEMEDGLRHRLPLYHRASPAEREELDHLCMDVDQLRQVLHLPQRIWPEGSVKGETAHDPTAVPFNVFPPQTVSWREIWLWNGFRMAVATDDERAIALRLFRRSGRLPPKFSLGERGPLLSQSEPALPYTHGVKAPEQIDWEGFPELPDCPACGGWGYNPEGRRTACKECKGTGIEQGHSLGGHLNGAATA